MKTMFLAVMIMGLASAHILKDFAVTFNASRIDTSAFNITEHVSDVQSCAAMCSEEPTCQSAVFDNNCCELYPIRPSMIGTSVYHVDPGFIPTSVAVLVEKLADVPVNADFVLEGSCGM